VEPKLCKNPGNARAENSAAAAPACVTATSISYDVAKALASAYTKKPSEKPSSLHEVIVEKMKGEGWSVYQNL
jgi:hypothetical protein